jgi:urea transporter
MDVTAEMASWKGAGNLVNKTGFDFTYMEVPPGPPLRNSSKVAKIVDLVGHYAPKIHLNPFHNEYIRFYLAPFRTLKGFAFWLTRNQIRTLQAVDVCLRSFGQVVFQNSPITGLFILIAMLTAEHSMIAVFAVLACICGNLYAYIMSYDRGLLTNGIWGYNAVLIGCALHTFVWDENIPLKDTEYHILFAVPFLGCITVIIAAATASILVPMELTPLTFPFQLATWLWFLAAQTWSNVQINNLPMKPQLVNVTVADLATPSYDPSRVVESIFTGVAQIFLIGDWWSGLLILIGIFLCSPISAVAAFIGSACGSLIGTAVGGDPDLIYAGLYSFNPALTSVALGTYLRHFFSM